MKKIVFFIPSLGQGGAEKIFLNLANELVKRHEVYLILQDAEGILMKELNANVQTFDFGMKNKFKLLLRFIKFISIHKPDVVISTLTIPNIINGFAHKLSSHKYRLITRQASPVKIRNNEKIITNALKFSFKNSNVIVANSNTTKRSIQQTLNLSEKEINIEVIYNPVYDKRFYDLANDKSIISEILSENGKFIFAMGRLEDSKNFKLLIEAYNISKTKDQCKLIILGEGSQRERLENLIVDLKLSKNVLLPGNISNPYPFYKKANLFISSSRWEGFGNVIVEALSFGLPVIITDNSGAPSEILENGKYGYLVENDSPQAMADKIDEVYYLNETNTHKLIERAMDFSIENITQQYESTFN